MPYPNPWYNPELAAEKLKNIQSAADNIHSQSVSMDEFLEKASSHTSDAVVSAITPKTHFTGNEADIDIDDIPSGGDDMVSGIFDVIKHFIDTLS